MNLRPGSRFALEVEPHGRRLKVTPRIRVGKSAVRDMGKPIVGDGWADIWIEIERLAQDELAKIGLAETERPR
jgi:hypothetical protein